MAIIPLGAEGYGIRITGCVTAEHVDVTRQVMEVMSIMVRHANGLD